MGTRISVRGNYPTIHAYGYKLYGYCAIRKCKSAHWLWEHYDSSYSLEDAHEGVDEYYETEDEFLDLIGSYPELFTFLMTADEYREFIDLYYADYLKLSVFDKVEWKNEPEFKALYESDRPKFVDWR